MESVVLAIATQLTEAADNPDAVRVLSNKLRKAADRPLPPELEGEKVVPLQVGAGIAGVSVDTLKRHYPVVRLSPRRLGIKIKHCLKMA
jgi:hypothetical protein